MYVCMFLLSRICVCGTTFAFVRTWVANKSKRIRPSVCVCVPDPTALYCLFDASKLIDVCHVYASMPYRCIGA